MMNTATQCRSAGVQTYSLESMSRWVNPCHSGGCRIRLLIKQAPTAEDLWFLRGIIMCLLLSHA
jgi:hypothetical protein